MQQPQYPVYGRNTRFVPTQLLQDQIAELGLSMPDALAIVRSGTAQSGRRPSQWWHIGEAGGKRFRVLVEVRTTEFVMMITINELH